MITITDYFLDSTTNYKHLPTPEDERNARRLIERVNLLLVHLGLDRKLTSGHRTRAKTLAMKAQGYGAAIGGTHESAEGIDLEDEDGELDDRITDPLLEQFSLYREHPSATRRWTHLQTKPPRSGNRSFYP